jgi:hypothetical protein
MKCAVEMVSCGLISIPNFMKTGTDIQAISMFCLIILRGRNAGTTGVSDI